MALGLINFFSDSTNGVYIEKAEDIVALFRRNERKIDDLSEQLVKQTTEISKLRNDYQIVSERNTQAHNLLSTKEENYKELYKEKDNLSIEKKALAFKYQELKERFSVLQEDHARLSQHVQQTNEGIYVNMETVHKNNVRELEKKNRFAEAQIHRMSEELTNAKSKIAKLEIERNSSESLLNRQTEEHDRIFTNYVKDLERTKRELKTARDLQQQWEKKLSDLSLENQELLEKSKVLHQKLRTKERVLRQMEVELNVSEKDHISIKVSPKYLSRFEYKVFLNIKY